MSTYLDRADRCQRVAQRSRHGANRAYGRWSSAPRQRSRAETVMPINVPTVRLEGSAGIRPATGKVPAHAAAPDPIEGSRHSVKRGRTKRGPTAVVTGYGLAHVVGDWIGTPNTDSDIDRGSESYPVWATVLEQSGALKRGARGMSSLDVYRITQRLYGDLIPALLSTDNDMHHAVVHGDDSDTDDYAIAWHNPSDPYAAMDQLGRTVPDAPIRYRTRGYGLTFGLPVECVTDRWKLRRVAVRQA